MEKSVESLIFWLAATLPSKLFLDLGSCFSSVDSGAGSFCSFFFGLTMGVIPSFIEGSRPATNFGLLTLDSCVKVLSSILSDRSLDFLDVFGESPYELSRLLFRLRSSLRFFFAAFLSALRAAAMSIVRQTNS